MNDILPAIEGKTVELVGGPKCGEIAAAEYDSYGLLRYGYAFGGKPYTAIYRREAGGKTALYVQG